MHSALFVAFPESNRNKIQDWQSFLGYAKNHIDTSKGALRLAENVWLLNLRVSLDPLGQLISCAERQGITYGLLQFERAPEWLPGGFDPTSILGQNAQS